MVYIVVTSHNSYCAIVYAEIITGIVKVRFFRKEIIVIDYTHFLHLTSLQFLSPARMTSWQVILYLCKLIYRIR